MERAKLTEENIARSLVRMTIPMIVGIAGMIVFNLVDTFYVGLLGVNELAAMGFTFPVLMIIHSVALGLGMGASSVISRSIGKNDSGEVKRLTTDALILSLLIVMFFAVFGFLTIHFTFKLVGAAEHLIPLISGYMKIWYLGVMFVVIPMVGNNAIRATGDTKTPSIIMLVSALINVILDPILIFGWGPFPRLELQGAAIATVIARAGGMAASLYFLIYKYKMITLEQVKLKIMFNSWKRILFISLPVAATNMIMPLSIGVVTRLVALYGVSAVAGFGVCAKIEMFVFAVIMALSAVLIPFVGQNFGAGETSRIKTAIKYSFRFSAAWGMFAYMVFLLFSRNIAEIFTNDRASADIIVKYMLIVGFSYVFYGIFQIAGSIFNGLNQPFKAASITVLRMFVLYIPLAILGSRYFQLNGIFYAAALANFLTGLFAFWQIKATSLKNFQQ